MKRRKVVNQLPIVRVDDGAVRWARRSDLGKDGDAWSKGLSGKVQVGSRSLGLVDEDGRAMRGAIEVRRSGSARLVMREGFFWALMTLEVVFVCQVCCRAGRAQGDWSSIRMWDRTLGESNGHVAPYEVCPVDPPWVAVAVASPVGETDPSYLLLQEAFGFAVVDRYYTSSES